MSALNRGSVEASSSHGRSESDDRTREVRTMRTFGIFATGNAEIDRDHHALISLLGRVIDIFCCDKAGQSGDCRGCGEQGMVRCGGTLASLATELGALMRDHFRREADLMKALPRTSPIATHCDRHHLVHIEFFTRFDLIATNLDRSDVISGARNLGTFLSDWLRRHALQYDSVLAGLVEALWAGYRSAHASVDRLENCVGGCCPEVQRGSDEAAKLRSLLAQALDHVPADHPLALEGFAALN